MIVNLAIELAGQSVGLNKEKNINFTYFCL
jgi:hypothetical protein